MNDIIRDTLLARRQQLVGVLAEISVTRSLATALAGDDGDRARAALDDSVAAVRRHQLLTALRAVDIALERVAAGDYGFCVDCGGAIPPRRLVVLPDALTCIACQEQRDRRAKRDGADAGRPWAGDED